MSYHCWSSSTISTLRSRGKAWATLDNDSLFFCTASGRNTVIFKKISFMHRKKKAGCEAACMEKPGYFRRTLSDSLLPKRTGQNVRHDFILSTKWSVSGVFSNIRKCLFTLLLTSCFVSINILIYIQWHKELSGFSGLYHRLSWFNSVWDRFIPKHCLLGGSTLQCTFPVAIRSKRKSNPIWAYYAHGRQRRCQEDPVGLPSGRLEKTTRSSPHHVAQHRPTGSETTRPYAPRSSRLAQNRPLWWMMSTYGATQSWAACQKRRWRRVVMTYLNRQYWKSSSPNVTFCINSFE